MKIGIIADSSSGLEYAPFEHHVKIARTTIRFGEHEYTDGVDIKAQEFYQMLPQTDIVPSTSAPTVGEICTRINELKDEGCTDIIFFAISYNLSAYGINLESYIKDFVKDVNFYVVNSNSACLMEGYLAKYAEILAEKNYDVETILQEIEKVKKNTKAFFVVDDLKYLVKNGRLNSVSGFIGSFAKIKPILELGENGKIETIEKVRTQNKALKRITELAIEEYKKYNRVIYLVLHSDATEKASEVQKEILDNVTNAKRIESTLITPTVGAHIGQGVVGIAGIVLDDLIEQL